MTLPAAASRVRRATRVGPAAPADGRATVAYVVSHFPALTEACILDEMLELERRGVRVELFSLRRHDDGVPIDAARDIGGRATYGAVGWSTLAAHAHFLRAAPTRYLGAWWAVLWGNRGSLGFLLRGIYVMLLAPAFARRMAERSVEHVHAHWATHPALMAFVVHRLVGTPYTLTVHAHDLYAERTMLAEKLAAADRVVTISDYNRDLLTRLFGGRFAAKTTVIRCGVDPTQFCPAPRSNAARGGTLTITCVAGLRAYKGHAYLIDAAALLRARGVAFRCLLAGEGAERRTIERRLAAAGLGDRVVLLGAIDRAGVAALLARTDVMVMPSVVLPSGQMEGIPVALMEAMAMAVPVVATAISGVGELVVDGQTGVLVPERDATALADAIASIAADRARAARLGVAGRARVLRDYDVRTNARRLAEVLHGACDSRAVAR